jgi:hypothetical protein
VVKPILIILVGGMTGLIFFLNPWDQGNLFDGLESVEYSLIALSYSEEIGIIKNSANDFMKIKEDPYSKESEEIAIALDLRLNNLELVKENCNQKISALDLARENDPYKKLQSICPILKNISLKQAANLWVGFT